MHRLGREVRIGGFVPRSRCGCLSIRPVLGGNLSTLSEFSWSRTWGNPFGGVVDDNLKERLEGRVLPTMTANLQDSLRLPDGIPMLRPQDDLKWGFRILTNQLKLPKMQAENFVRLGKRTNQRFLQLGSSLVP